MSWTVKALFLVHFGVVCVDLVLASLQVLQEDDGADQNRDLSDKYEGEERRERETGI